MMQQRWNVVRTVILWRCSGFLLLTIALVHMSPLPAMGQQPRLALEVEEAFVIDGSRPDVNLTRPGDVEVGATGDFYVLDVTDQSVIRFSEGGQFEGRIGRRGAGPGEFFDARKLMLVGDRLMVLDVGQRLVHEFTAGGRFVDAKRMPTVRNTQIGVAVPMREGSWIGLTEARYTWNLVSGKVNVPGRIVLVGDRDPVVTELLEYESQVPLWYERNTGLPWGPARGFGGAAHWDVIGDSAVVIGDGLSGQLRWYSATVDSFPLVGVVDTDLGGRPVASADRDRLIGRARRTLQAIPRNAEWLIPQLKPGITKLLVDSEGCVWVRGPLDTAEWAFPDWTVIGTSGRRAVDITLPMDLDVRAITRTRIYGFSVGPMDVPVLRVMRFQRRGLVDC